MSRQETFATAFNCIEEQVKAPVVVFIQEKTGVEFVDTITEPGIEGYIVDGINGNTSNLVQVRRKLLMSTNNHKSKGIVVAGHEDCKYNPRDHIVKEGQLVMAVRAITDIAREENINAPVFAVYVYRSPQEQWEASEIDVPKRIFRSVPQRPQRP